MHVHVAVWHVLPRLLERGVRLGGLAEFGVRLGQREAGRRPQTRCDAVVLDTRERFVQEFDSAGQFSANQIGLTKQEHQVRVGQTRNLVHGVGHLLGDHHAVVDTAGQPAGAGIDAAEPEP